MEAGWLDTPRPAGRGPLLWRGDHPELGVWHAPDTEERHKRPCFDVAVRTNSVGARDRERPRRAAAPRVVVLGDSFFEGWGVEAAERLSDRLEAETGIPHLNFAMSHFGVYQQALAYARVARDFEHRAVIASLVPANDFTDADLELALRDPGYGYRYRPYLVEVTEPGGGARFAHREHREPAPRRWLRRHSYAFQAGLAAWRGLRASRAEPADTPSRVPSRFYDFADRPFRLVVAALERLVAEADGRPVALVLVPGPRDVARYLRSGPDPLSQRLAPVAARLGVTVVNLLPAMAQDARRDAFFHACDYHWSAAGHAFATARLREALAADFYAGLRP